MSDSAPNYPTIEDVIGATPLVSSPLHPAAVAIEASAPAMSTPMS